MHLAPIPSGYFVLANRSTGAGMRKAMGKNDEGMGSGREEMGRDSVKLSREE